MTFILEKVLFSVHNSIELLPVKQAICILHFFFFSALYILFAGFRLINSIPGSFQKLWAMQFL